MTGKTFHPSAGPGFTLVELLIVVVIIGLLAGMLISAVGAAFELSYSIKCRSNMAQIAKAVLQYAAQNQQQIVPAVYRRDGAGNLYSNIYDAPHWCNILVDGGYIDSPNTSSLGDSERTTPKENVFRCPGTIDKRWTDTSKYPSAPTFKDDAVCGFIRVGRPGHKIDCAYYWNGSSDTTVDPTTGKMAALDFPSMAVPLGNLTMDDVRADPSPHFHTLDSLNSLKTTSSTETGSFSAYTIGNLTTTVMLTDGVGLDAGTGAKQDSRARISAPHASGAAGNRSVTNRVYWDGHADSDPPARAKDITTDAIWLSDGLKGTGMRLSDH